MGFLFSEPSPLVGKQTAWLQIDLSVGYLKSKRGFFERRGREDYAKNAEEE
jgi:hypothetical protein